MRLRLCVFTLSLVAMLMLPANFFSTHSAPLAAPPTNATVVNLALQKPATQSSNDSGNTADRAVDGNNGTFSQTLSEVHAWWQLDLGEIAYVDKMVITTRADCCSGDIRFVTAFSSEVPLVSTDLTATHNQAEVSEKKDNPLFGAAQFTTTIDLQRSARYLRLQVQTDNPANLYLAEVQVMGIRVVPNTPATTGQWTAVPPLHNSVDNFSVGHTSNSLSLVHLSVLPSKKLLFWGRDKLPTSTGNEGYMDDVQGASDAFLWDMTKQDDPSTPLLDERLTLIRNTTTNLFCAGHSFLPNGNLFAAGGDSIPVDNIGAQRFDLDGHGVTQTNIFDWKQEKWVAGPTMRQPRWYPSLLTMSDGQSLIMSGSFVTFDQPNIYRGNQDKDTEILTRNGTLQRTTDLTMDLPNYPFSHLMPDGTPFVVSGTSGKALTYNSSTGVWTAQPNLNLTQLHDQGTSVMYDRGKLIVIGGRTGVGVSRETELLDFTAVSPQWNPGLPLHFARYYASPVLMPDGKIFIIGGSKCDGANNLQTTDGTCRNGAVMYPEIYDPNPDPPDTPSWSIMARQQTVRMYHSVALLLPDARIMVAGGGRPGALGEPGELKYLAHHEVEIFSPPYLFNANGSAATRPLITTTTPESITYNQTFNVGVGNFTASEIQKVVLVRLPSVTHALNFDQQRVVLSKQVVDQQTLTLTAPANGTYAAPGPYMLFVIGPNGAPSAANIVLLGNTPPAPLPPNPVYPANNTLHAPASFTLQWNDGLDAARRNPLWPVTYAIYFKSWAYGATEPAAYSLFGSGFQCNPNASGICSMAVSGIGDGNYRFYVVANMDVSAATGVPNTILSTQSSLIYFTVGYQPISTIPAPLPPNIVFPNDGNVNVPSNFTVRWSDGLDASRRFPFWPVTYAIYYKSWGIGGTEPTSYTLSSSGMPCNPDSSGLCTMVVTGLGSANYRFYVVASMDVSASTGVANSILSTQGNPVFFSIPLIVTLSPATPITLFGGQSQQFTATVSGASNTAVTWSINPVVGSINTAGLYVTPNPITANQTITVKACSVVDTSRCATDTVTLVPLTVAVTPKTANLLAGQTVQFSASVSGASNAAVTWSLSPAIAAAGSIDPNTGFYTAPSVVSTVTSVTVTARSVANSSITDQATITLRGPAVTLAPSSINFGALPLGATSAARTATLTNSGTATLSIAGISRTGDFAITGNTCGTSLAVGASCTITLTFTPAAVGLRTGTLTVTDNVAGSPHTVSLSGSVLQGYHDVANCEGMAGWAWDSAQPNTPITVYLYEGTRYLGSAYAGDYRPDLAGSYGNGYHGFAWGNVPSLLDGAPHTVSVHYAQDPNSPLLNTTPRTIACSPNVSIAWIQPSGLTWGPANTLTAAGFATQGSGNVTLQWRDVTLNGPWNTVGYQAPRDPNNGGWSNTIPSADTCHVFQAIAQFSGVSASGNYNGVAQGYCSFRVIWIQPQASAGFGPPGSLVIAGSAQGGPSGALVTLWFRDDTAQSAWTPLSYQAPTDANGIWYNAIENVNYSHQYSVYITYDDISSGACSYNGNNQATTCP
jgi:hypothetical protein